MRKIEIVSVAILNPEKELLLVRKKGSTFFQLTGGKPKVGETHFDTLYREAKEEIGFTILESELEFLGTHETQAVNETNTIVLGNIYLLKLKDFIQPNLANEIEEFAWLNAGNFKKYNWAHLAEEFVLPICKNIWKIA